MTTIPPFGQFVVPPPDALLPTGLFGEGPQEVTQGSRGDATVVIEHYREKLIRQEALFEDVYRLIEATDATPAQIEGAADEVHEYKERALRAGNASFQRIIRGVQSYQKRRDHIARSMVRLGEEMLDICAAWLELYQNLEIRLRKLASDRDAAPKSKPFSDSAEAVAHLRALTADR
jgi:hypothetical protein